MTVFTQAPPSPVRIVPYNTTGVSRNTGRLSLRRVVFRLKATQPQSSTLFSSLTAASPGCRAYIFFFVAGFRRGWYMAKALFFRPPFLFDVTRLPLRQRQTSSGVSSAQAAKSGGGALILAGPPGTGKSTVFKAVAVSFPGPRRSWLAGPHS